jgi:hypothetical protein
LNGTTATASMWSSTGIVVTVPNGAASGNVVVNVGGVNSNGVPFWIRGNSGRKSMEQILEQVRATARSLLMDWQPP